MLSGLCRIGERAREHDREPFLSALRERTFGSGADKMAVSHLLGSGQRLDTSSNVDSLFQVRFGEVKLRIRCDSVTGCFEGLLVS